MLQWYNGTVVQWYNGTMLQCYNSTVVTGVCITEL